MGVINSAGMHPLPNVFEDYYMLFGNKLQAHFWRAPEPRAPKQERHLKLPPEQGFWQRRCDVDLSSIGASCRMTQTPDGGYGLQWSD
jgi:hypothetical protein